MEICFRQLKDRKNIELMFIEWK